MLTYKITIAPCSAKSGQDPLPTAFSNLKMIFFPLSISVLIHLRFSSDPSQLSLCRCGKKRKSLIFPFDRTKFNLSRLCNSHFLPQESAGPQGHALRADWLLEEEYALLIGSIHSQGQTAQPEFSERLQLLFQVSQLLKGLPSMLKKKAKKKANVVQQFLRLSGKSPEILFFILLSEETVELINNS